MHKRHWSAIGLLIVLSHAAPAAGAVIATYQGVPFTPSLGHSIVDNPLPVGSYDTTMRVTATLVLDAPVPPDFIGSVSVSSFTVSDGRSTITESSATSWEFSFRTTHASGALDWEFRVYAPRASIISSAYLGDMGILYDCDPPCTDWDSMHVGGGSWTFVPIPEPSTAALLALGMAALAIRSRRVTR